MWVQMMLRGGGSYKRNVQAENETTVQFTNLTSINAFGCHNSSMNKRYYPLYFQRGKQSFKVGK